MGVSGQACHEACLYSASANPRELTPPGRGPAALGFFLLIPPLHESAGLDTGTVGSQEDDRGAVGGVVEGRWEVRWGAQGGVRG